jgi:hypothetical protein
MRARQHQLLRRSARISHPPTLDENLDVETIPRMDWDDLFTAPVPSGSDWAWQDDLLPVPTASVSSTNISEIHKPYSPGDSVGLLENASAPSTPLTPDCSSERDGQVVLRRRPIPRKGHTKSRRGCFNCKKRKIKCQETRPMCGNCDKSGIPCQYPKALHSAPSPISVSVPSPIMQPQATPTVFSMVDMRYFHHFLVRAYPHLPVGSDSIWTLQIPAYAHKVSDMHKFSTSVQILTSPVWVSPSIHASSGGITPHSD